MADEIIEELHRYRAAHAAAFDYDLRRMAADWQRRQRISNAPLVSLPPKPPMTTPAVPAERASDEPSTP